MTDLRSQLPPGVDVDSLSSEARRELKDLIERYGSLEKIPHFEVDNPEALTVYLQANFDGHEILKLLLQQRNKVKKHLLEEDGFEAYEDVPADISFDQVMAADIFVDDMKVLNRFNQFFGGVHKILNEVEDEFEDAMAEEAIQEVRDKLKLKYPEDSEELREELTGPLE